MSYFDSPPPAQVLTNTGPQSGHFVTVVTTRKPCGKHASINTDGQLLFESRGPSVAGTAKVEHAPSPESLLALLSGLTDHQYVIPDFIPETIALEAFELLTQKDHESRFPEAKKRPVQQGDRLYACLNVDDWRFGNWRVLDRDVDASTPERFHVPYEQWIELANRLLPGVATAPRVFWPSSKARVQKIDPNSAVNLNGHTWIDCSGGGVELTNAMRSRLLLRAAELGLTWDVPRIAKATGEPLSGKGCTKTILDVSVWSTHRQIYAGAPTVADGLQLVATSGFAIPGSAIDLHKALPVPSDKALRRYSEQTGTEASVKPNGTVSFTDRDSLTLEHKVELEGGAVMTLKDFWEASELTFDTKYRCQAILRKSSSWNGILRKYAGGRIVHYDNGTSVTYVLDVNARKVEEVEPIEPPDYFDPSSQHGEVPFPPGLAGDVAEFAMSAFRMPNRDFAIACALQTLSVVNANYRYVGVSDTPLNLYQCLVADTGKGKEDPRKLLKLLVEKSGSSVAVMETLASGPALLRALDARRHVAICTDELGLVLQSALNQTGSQHVKDLLRELMAVYGLGRSSYAGKYYADVKQNIGKIERPYTCLLGTTTPSTLTDGLSQASIDNGFLNRLLVVLQTGPVRVNRNQVFAPPESLHEQLRALAPPAPPHPHTPLPMDYASGAQEELIRLIEELQADAEVPALWARVEEQTIRVAGCLALGDGGEIKTEHVVWAAAWVGRGLVSLEKLLREGMHSSAFEKQRSKVLKVIRNVKNYVKDKRFGGLCRLGYMPRGKLVKTVGLRPPELDQALTSLIEGGEITEQKVENQTVYTAISEG